MADPPEPTGDGPPREFERPTQIVQAPDASERGPRSSPRRDTGGSKIEPGLLLGHTWVVEEFLGRGGMGEVWRCRHVELGSEHAIKIILPELANEPNFVALFKEEARRLSRLQSDAIVRYEGLFRDEWGRQYLVMEFVDGPSLSSVLKNGRPSVHEIRQLLNRVALGLAAAHDQGILHRDVSPDNIILPEGRIEGAKIIDFGIAKSLRPGDVTLIGSKFAGKNAFVSPEQAGLFGGHVDARSDIYCLGLVLAATALGFGRHLDMGSSPVSIIEARRSVPDLREIPPGLRSLLTWMLQPDPSRRPQSIRALLARARGMLAGNETSDTVSSPLPYRGAPSQPASDTMARAPLAAVSDADRLDARRTRRTAGKTRGPRRRRRWGIAAGGAIAAIAAAVASYYYYDRYHPRIPVANLGGIAAEARAAIRDSCALLDVRVKPDGSGGALRIAGVVGGVDESARLDAVLRQVPSVSRVVDEALQVPSSRCPALRTLAAILQDREARGLQIVMGAGSHDNVVVADAGELSVQLAESGGQFAFLYVDAFFPDGIVAHLLPSSTQTNNLLLRGQQIAIDGRAALSRAQGPVILSVIAAPKLLLAAANSGEESSDRYAAALESAIEQLSREREQGNVTGAWRVLQTHPK
jgi:hypothetical protein